MVQHYYRNVHAVMFVYDVTRLSSFESLPSWINECESYGLGTGVPRILVGNKCDLTSSSDSSTVSTSLAQRFADMHDMPLFETSAKDNSQSDHVESIFLTLAHKLKNSKPMMIQQPAAKPLVLSSSTHQQSTDTSTGCWC
jgi:Ras-related protein Rab-33B